MNPSREAAMAIAMLAEGFGVKDLSEATIKIYSKALQKIPAPLLSPMVEHCLETRKGYRKLPEIAELRADAEWARRDIMARNPWTPCCDCEDSPGFVPVLVEGVPRVAKCPCRVRYAERLAQLGVGPSLALPPADDQRLLASGASGE
jgi:hypothetical protein